MGSKKRMSNNKEILVVEDSATQREQIKHILTGHGYSVQTAADGQEALKSIAKYSPTLIVSDILMPRMDGYALCREIRSHKEFKDIPVILLTSLSGPEDIIKGLECGADNFIRKPFDEKYLLSRIDYVVANRRLRKSEKLQMGVELYLGGKRHFITAERQQILDLLISTYEQAVKLNEDLKASESQVVRSNKILEGLYRIATGLNRAASEQELLEQVLDRALELPGIIAGWIVLYEGESKFRAAAVRGLPHALSKPKALEGDCSCHRKLLSGEIKRATVISDCDRFADCRDRQLHSHVTIPLRADNRPAGILNLVVASESPFSDSDLQTLNGIGNQIGVALERTRMRDHLEQLVQARTAALTAEITERKQAEKALEQERNLLGTLMDSLPDRIYVKGKDCRFLLNNVAHVKALGARSQGEVFGKTDFDFRPRELAQFSFEADQQVLRSGIPLINQEEKTVLSDGSTGWLLVTKVPMRDEQRNVVGLIGISRDVTERKRAEEALRVFNERFRQIMTQVNDVVWRASADGTKILDVNQAFERIYGMPVHDFESNPNIWLDRVLPADLAIAQASADTLLRTGQSVAEYRILHPDSGTRWILDRKTILYDEQGNPTSIGGVATDITERKRAEEASRASEARFQSLADNSFEGLSFSEAGVIVDANDQLGDAFGYARQDLIGKHLMDLVAPESRDLVRSTLGTDVVGPYEFVGLRRDGTTFYAEVRARLVDIGGRKLRVRAIRDITERKSAEVELQRNEEWLQAILNTSRDGVVVEKSGTIVYANLAFARIFGYEHPDELIGQHASVVQAPEDRGRILYYATKRSQGTSMPDVYEFRGIRKDGKLVDLEASVSAARLAGEEHIVTAVRDLTERKLLQKQVVEAQKMESIGTLAGGIAHDFNNILGIILGHATLLERLAHEPQKWSRSVEAINTATSRGASLVRQLLTFARKADLSMGPVYISDLLKELKRLLEETFPKSVTISVNLKQDLPPVVADSTQLHQVFLNLCVNARDAMMPKGGTLTLLTRLVSGSQVNERFGRAGASEYVQVDVGDTGTGMDEGTLKRIFEPFFTTKEKGKGTGLGLSTVFGIVEGHRGFVDVKSELGKGTVFHVFLPASAREVMRKEFAKPLEPEQRGKGETILLIEDEQILQDLAATLLAETGYHVLTAADGEVGLEIFSGNPKGIALVLTDLGLPKLGGEELVEQLLRVNPKAKILMASGFVEPDVKSRMLRLGAKDFIQKPYAPTEMVQKIRLALDAP